jgi:uronate dehydrogenase
VGKCARVQRVVITGVRGVVGQVLEPALREDYEVVGVDARRRGPGTARRLDTARPRHARRAVRAADVVIDLASASWKAPFRTVAANNIPSVWHMLDAARRAGARRVIYASSNHVTGGYERDEPYASVVAGRYEGRNPVDIVKITTTMAVRPDSAYAAGKAFGEAAARLYADRHDLSVICLRIGTLNRAGRPSEPRHFATLITHPDMVQLVRRCIDAPADVRFGVFYGVSNNTWRIWDIDDARDTIGYEPCDDAEQWRAAAPPTAAAPPRDREPTPR